MWTQEEYESRLETEAELMIALEALRETLIYMEKDVNNLYDCMDEFRSGLNECTDELWDHNMPEVE